jgi:hypothetical protein
MGERGATMKWMLVVMVFGSGAVKTDLVFDSLKECLATEQSMRAQYADAYNVWNSWAEKNQAEAGYPNSRDGMKKRFGLYNSATCIPHRGQ